MSPPKVDGCAWLDEEPITPQTGFHEVGIEALDEGLVIVASVRKKHPGRSFLILNIAHGSFLSSVSTPVPAQTSMANLAVNQSERFKLLSNCEPNHTRDFVLQTSGHMVCKWEITETPVWNCVNPPVRFSLPISADVQASVFGHHSDRELTLTPGNLPSFCGAFTSQRV